MLYPQNGDRIVTTDSVTSFHPVRSASVRAALHGEQIVSWADDRRGKNRHATAASTDVERERERERGSVGSFACHQSCAVALAVVAAAAAAARTLPAPTFIARRLLAAPSPPPPARDQYSTKRDRYFQTVPGTAIRYVGHLNFGWSRV